MKISAVFLLFVFLNVHAQETATSAPSVATPTSPAPVPTSAALPAKAPDTSKAMQKIVVTGSYIRRAADEDSPSPVTQIDAVKAAEAGSYSVAGMLNDSAVTSSGGSTVSFHGQSSANNLVLLNGMRLPKAAGGDTVDISFIAASAIERTEILKDGASALYGSEALAGVVNIITKKDYDGANVMLRYSSPEKNVRQETTFVGTYGKQWGKTNVLGVMQYSRTENLFYRDTEFGMKNVKKNGSLAGDPPNIIDLGNSNKKYTSANCPADRLTSKGECRYNYYDTLQFDPQKSIYNVLLSTGTDLDKGWRLESALIYNLANSKAANTPPITEFEDYSGAGGSNFAIPKATADTWASLVKDKDGNTPGSFTGPIKLQYSPDKEIGPRLSESNVQTGVAQVKIGKESDTIDWEFSVGYGLTESKNTTYSGNANKQMLFNKLNDLSWNPFKDSNNKDVSAVQDALIQTWYKNSATIINPRTIVSGKLFNLGSQGVYAASGLEGQWQDYEFRNDPLSTQGLPLTGLFSPQEGKRNVSSGFIELTYNPINTLQLQVAGRYDKYSDFGSTFNPKLAAAYKFSDKVMGRMSYGTGFKAPDLSALFQGNVTRPQRFRDEVVCRIDKNDPNCSNLFTTTSYGNRDLDAEKGQHYNIGMQFRPHKKVQVTIDHWRAYGTEALQEVNLGDLTVAEANFGTGVLNDLGVTINRNPDQSIQSVTYPVKVNSGKYKLYGIDFDVTYRTQINPWGLGGMGLTVKMDHSHNMVEEDQDYSFAPLRRNFNLRWKNVASVSLSKGSNLISYRMRSFAASDKDGTLGDGIGIGSIPMYQEHDLHYEYYGFGTAVVTLGVRNIFDRKVYTEFTRGRDGFLLPANITALGRGFYLAYSQDF